MHEEIMDIVAKIDELRSRLDYMVYDQAGGCLNEACAQLEAAAFLLTQKSA